MLPEGMDMDSLMQQAQAMQSQMQQAQNDLAALQIEGTAGGGLVTATVNGTGELQALVIKPEAVDPEDTESLSDLIVAAVRDANGQAATIAAEKLGPLAQGLPGLG